VAAGAAGGVVKTRGEEMNKDCKHAYYMEIRQRNRAVLSEGFTFCDLKQKPDKPVAFDYANNRLWPTVDKMTLHLRCLWENKKKCKGYEKKQAGF
jgi:hypothetical protein